LHVYRKAFSLAMEVYEISKKFPKEEKYSLIDQMRRSSRSVCANLREAWAKRRYVAHFISKLTDCDGENAETETWLDFAFECHYVQEEKYQKLISRNHFIGQKLGVMISKADQFCKQTDN